ncbi:hypothetical protein EMIHUDRAFT_354520 [Emiliania huxleyi CCMP1516]|uniref:Uncharacterized protein n=2 Tax=Emiliania huxleyi TaxID=2903 RepID=A0A0D3JK78_EMIH1|nr:hypothetical protein EMIHUDRAFT_354520 [Emiliania huxleyi CCMP1516]EOD23913.1 hypothetical protein EMIHUDRAFT_354520 [Emiliania huxleyi CCMP1516]|eukprot:XP_005776342.1 hypothetical protein EMIHUDRAFT_354520 [Emiliania huxleyi CCMP1516]
MTACAGRVGRWVESAGGGSLDVGRAVNGESTGGGAGARPQAVSHPPWVPRGEAAV